MLAGSRRRTEDVGPARAPYCSASAKEPCGVNGCADFSWESTDSKVSLSPSSLWSIKRGVVVYNQKHAGTLCHNPCLYGHLDKRPSCAQDDTVASLHTLWHHLKSMHLDHHHVPLILVMGPNSGTKNTGLNSGSKQRKSVDDRYIISLRTSFTTKYGIAYGHTHDA